MLRADTTCKWAFHSYSSLSIKSYVWRSKSEGIMTRNRLMEVFGQNNFQSVVCNEKSFLVLPLRQLRKLEKIHLLKKSQWKQKHYIVFKWTIYFYYNKQTFNLDLLTLVVFFQKKINFISFCWLWKCQSWIRLLITNLSDERENLPHNIWKDLSQLSWVDFK